MPDSLADPLPAPPLISVVIPTCNRPDVLPGCLGALQAQDYPSARFEVIVVDDGGTAPLDAVVRPFESRMAVRLIRQPNAGPGAARNTGAAAARGTLLAFTDDDCRPAPDWLAVLAAGFTEAADPNVLLGGRVVNVLTENRYAAASQALVQYLVRYYNADPDQARFFTSNNMAVAACAFRAQGGFDERHVRIASEDRELCDRWLHLGYRLRYMPGALVYHAHRMSLAGFWRQHFGYGRGALGYHRARRARGAPPVPLEPFAFYRDMLLFPVRRDAGWRGLTQAALLALSQVAAASGYFWERARR